MGEWGSDEDQMKNWESDLRASAGIPLTIRAQI